VASPTELHSETDLASEDGRRSEQHPQRGRRESGSHGHVDDGHQDIPDLISLAPAIFVPATFDYTKPQAAVEPGEEGSAWLTQQATHAMAVKANMSWMLQREARRIHREAIAQENAMQQQYQQYQQRQASTPASAVTPTGRVAGAGWPPADPCRSRRLSPSRMDDNLMLRNLYAAPTIIQPLDPRHQQQHPPTTATSAPASGQAAAETAAAPPPHRTGSGLPLQFSWRDVPQLPVDARDTPREAATTRFLELVRGGEGHMEIYEAHAQAVMARRREAIAREQAEGVMVAREEATV
jgi:hypothetical protein